MNQLKIDIFYFPPLPFSFKKRGSTKLFSMFGMKSQNEYASSY